MMTFTRQTAFSDACRLAAFLLLLLFTNSDAQTLPEELSLLPEGNNEDIIIDGFVEPVTCYEHLVEADANGNNDGKVQANEYVTFVQLQTPGGQLDEMNSFQEMPLALQAAFVSLTCLCRDERFGGDPRDVNCCLGIDAHLPVVGYGEDSSPRDETRLFATCFLTDKGIATVLGSDPPSSSPSLEPSAMPSLVPTTLAPITGPPVTAAPSTDAPTTNVPSVAPTLSLAPTTTTATPTLKVVENTQVVYTISVTDGSSENIEFTEYENDLVSAMNTLATAMAPRVFTSTSSTSRSVGGVRRHLQAEVRLPTMVTAVEVTECNPGLANPAFDRCENIGHRITLVDSVDIPDEDLALFETTITEAIARGDLQRNLPPDSVVRILTGLEPTEVDQAVGTDDDDDGLSGGATAGIVAGALVVAILPMALYLSMRRNQEEKEPYGTYEPQDVGDEMQGHEDDDDVEATAKGVQTNLGASATDYGKSRSKAPPNTEFTPLHKVPAVSPDRDAARKGHNDDSSSNAGSSGWSSSAGLSSLNTGSAEDSMDMLNSPPGSSLAAIGAASAVARRMENRIAISPMSTGLENLEVPDGAISRNDLDNAIEAGDWAAVGATAALLAAASDSQSASSRSRTSRASRSQNASSVSSADAARAAELDHLVDAGDWEGVVLAAAKFESQEGSVKSGTASSVRSSSVGSETRSGTGSGFTPSVSTSVSESASKARKRAEIRQEVEALVRRVVPEELDNIDEMMQQFKGREEELVETLRTMQERAVAQKARTAGHKAAKQEARRTVQRGGIPGAVQSPDAPDSAAGASESQRERTALEEAIEGGDWDAVAEAAALMSDASMTSASTADVERQAAAARLGAGLAASSSISGVNAERARELDELIDRGDWTAVVDAAGRFSQADKDTSMTSSAGSPKRPIQSSGSQDSDSKRNKQLKEEEDALAQAEIWTQIAAQSKTEGGEATGASEAADWAIARSLKSLKSAETAGSGGAGGSKGSRNSATADDESV